MSLFARVYRLIGAKEGSRLEDFDSVEATDQDAAKIKSKPVLKKIYLEKYRSMVRAMERFEEANGGEILELGSGGGFFKEVLPEAIDALNASLELNPQRCELHPTSVRLIREDRAENSDSGVLNCVIVPGPPTSCQVSGSTVSVIRLINCVESAAVPPPPYSPGGCPPGGPNGGCMKPPSRSSAICAKAWPAMRGIPLFEPTFICPPPSPERLAPVIVVPLGSDTPNPVKL